MNEKSRSEKVFDLTQEFINREGSRFYDFSSATNEYDADNEVFKITFSNNKSIFLPVPIDEAKVFDKNFKSVKYVEPEFTYSEGDYEILSVEAVNPANGKRYVFKSSTLVAFNTNSLELNFDKLDISINSVDVQNNVSGNARIIVLGKSDVDENIPKNSVLYPNRSALIIGNEDYSKYQSGLKNESNVDFARLDAISFSNYCAETLGVPAENIVLITDAISSQMNQEIEKLIKLAKYSNGNAELILYYAGHGLPEEGSKEGYLMPVDISGSEINYGIKLSDLYKKLTRYPTKKVAVFLDACFSGGGRNQGLIAARGVKIAPKKILLTETWLCFPAVVESKVHFHIPINNMECLPISFLKY